MLNHSHTERPRRWQRGSAVSSALALLGALGCAAEAPATEVVTTEWDDLGVAMDCEGTDPSTNCLEPSENTLRIDDEVRMNWMNADFDADTSTLRVRLAPGGTLDERIQVGTVLYRGRRDRRPLMHRVTSLTVDGDRVLMQLEPTDVRQAFRRGRIRARIPGRGMMPGREGAAVESLRARLGVDDCSGTVIDAPLVRPGVPEGRVTLELTECSFSLSFWIDIVLVWDGFLNLDKFEAVVGGGFDASLHAALEAELEIAAGGSTRIAEFPPIPVVIGGLSFTITPSLHAGYNFFASSVLQVEAGFDYSGSVEAGFGWSDTRGFYTIDERESSFTEFGPNVYFDGHAVARVYLEPRVDLKVFGVLGGFVTLEAFAEATLTSTASLSGGEYTGEVCADLDVGLQPGLGVVFDLPGVPPLFEEEVELNPLTVSLVENACTAWSGPAPSDCGDGSTCCVDGECPDPELNGVTARCERRTANGDGTYGYRCNNHYPEDFCLDDEDCADGVATTTDTCVDNACVNAPNDVEVFSPDTFLCPRGEECCYTNSDCSDGNFATIDRCVKDNVDDGPEVQGVCRHTSR